MQNTDTQPVETSVDSSAVEQAAAPAEEVLTAPPAIAVPVKEKPEKPIPKIRGITLGKKKKPGIQKGKPETASELREQLSSLLTALTKVRMGDKRRWVDMCNANKSMAKVEAQMKKTRFYVWSIFGTAHYLTTVHLEKPQAVAYILPEGRNFRWTVENSRSTSGVESNLQKAKDTVMLYRDSFPV